METNHKHHPRHTGNYWLAAIFIAVGVLLLGKNLDIIPYHIYRIFVSWQMLLVVIGVYYLSARKLVPSVILIAVGVYFLLPRFTGITHTVSVFFWPVVFIVIGVLLILKFTGSAPGHNHHRHHHRHHAEKTEYTSADGFVHAENSFGSIQQTVVDEIFKGAVIKNSFGSVIIDLRRTSLPEGNTYIDVNVSFGGVEIYVPSTWNVKSEVRSFLGGFEDTRVVGLITDNDRVLIIRGEVSFSGVEIKS